MACNTRHWIRWSGNLRGACGGAGEYFMANEFMAKVDRVSLAWAAGRLILRKGSIISMEICPSPLKEVCNDLMLIRSDSGK